MNFLRRLVLLEKKNTRWQFASRCRWIRTRPWHVSELVSFLVGLRTYQHNGIVKFPLNSGVYCYMVVVYDNRYLHIAHLPQLCHNSKFVIFQDERLKILKCYNFLWVQRRHNCSPAASFTNCVMTLYLLKVHLQTFLSTPIIKKCKILRWDTLLSQMRGMGYYFNINPRIYTINCVVVYLKRSVMAANDAATNLNSYPKRGA